VGGEILTDGTDTHNPTFFIAQDGVAPGKSKPLTVFGYQRALTGADNLALQQSAMDFATVAPFFFIGKQLVPVLVNDIGGRPPHPTAQKLVGVKHFARGRDDHRRELNTLDQGTKRMFKKSIVVDWLAHKSFLRFIGRYSSAFCPPKTDLKYWDEAFGCQLIPLI
jgi:hypothetical protein